MQKETRDWLEYARRDLDAAEKNAEVGISYVAVVLAQQAAEKALKALLVERTGEPPPRTHSLEALAAQLRLSDEAPDGTVDLTRYYTTARYPDGSSESGEEDVSQATAEWAIGVARGILELVEEHL